MNTPFNKSFCGKSPLNELTSRQEANLPEALKTAIEAKSPTNYGSPLEQFNPKTASIMADAASLGMRAKRRGISGERQMQIDQENYGTTLEKLYRGESSKKILGHKPEPQKFGGRDWEFENDGTGKVPKYKSSALNQNKEKKKKELPQAVKDSLQQKALKRGKPFYSKKHKVYVEGEDGVLSRTPVNTSSYEKL
jgi:hypothetical protein